MPHDLSHNLNLISPDAVSPTLAADARVSGLRRAGREVLHMGFGQAPFPAPPRLVDALRAHAAARSYLPVAGLPELRRAVADHQARHLGTDADSVDVLVAPGSKLILYAVQMAVAGDLLLPAPSWVSYAPQAALLGQRVIPVATELDAAGYGITAETLEHAISKARGAGQRPTKLMLNYPNNPTGLMLPETAMAEIAEVCIREGILIIADEIYGRLTFDGRYRSISTHAPNHTVVTSGLSKHLSLGGWRLGVGIVPKAISGLFEALSRIASETWSCVAAPVQMAATEAYAGHADIETFITQCTSIHAAMTRYVAGGLRAAGVPCLDAQGGFYVWPDFGAMEGAATSDALAARLAEEHGLVALPGSAFGIDPAQLRLRLSVCDYDGADALSHLHAQGSFNTGDVPEVAPRVAAAVRTLAEFAAAP